MFAWILGRVWWFAWRAGLTLACIAIIQNLIVREGYRCRFDTLLDAAIATIIAVRVWMPRGADL